MAIASLQSTKFKPPIERMVSLMVSNLPWNVASSDLSEIFAPYGSIGDIYIPRDRNTNLLRRFGFVRFYDRSSAVCAVHEVNGAILKGQRLNVKLAEDKQNANISTSRSSTKSFFASSNSTVTGRTVKRRNGSWYSSNSRRRVVSSGRKPLGENRINALPDELLIAIFELLDHRTLLSLEKVCRRWKALAAHSWSNTTDVHLGSFGNVQTISELLQVVNRGGAHVTKFSASNFGLPLPTMCRVLDCCPNLKTLFVDYAGLAFGKHTLNSNNPGRLYSAHRQVFQRLSRLETLVIFDPWVYTLPNRTEPRGVEWQPFQAELYRYMSFLVSLKRLHLSNVFISGAVFKSVCRGLTHLESLVVTGDFAAVTVEDAKQGLQSLHALRDLTIYAEFDNNRHLGDTGLAAIVDGCPELEFFCLAKCGITETGLKNLFKSASKLKAFLLARNNEVTQHHLVSALEFRPIKFGPLHVLVDFFMVIDRAQPPIVDPRRALVATFENHDFGLFVADDSILEHEALPIVECMRQYWAFAHLLIAQQKAICFSNDSDDESNYAPSSWPDSDNDDYDFDDLFDDYDAEFLYPGFHYDYDESEIVMHILGLNAPDGYDFHFGGFEGLGNDDENEVD